MKKHNQIEQEQSRSSQSIEKSQPEDYKGKSGKYERNLIKTLLVIVLGSICFFTLKHYESDQSQFVSKQNNRNLNSIQKMQVKENQIDKENEKNKNEKGIVKIQNKPINYIWLDNQKNSITIPIFMSAKLQTSFYAKNYIRNYEWEKLGGSFKQYDLQIIHRVNILKLLYLYYNGGVIVDIDAPIDYSCLMKLLANKKGVWMAGEPWNTQYPSAGNWILYASQKKNPKIKKALKSIKKNLKITTSERLNSKKTDVVASLTGSIPIAKAGVKKLQQIYTCAQHFRKHLWNI